jgi:hypothetical protein
MPMTYQIDANAGMLCVVVDGETTQAEVLKVMQTWMRDPAFQPGLPTLADVSKATTLPTLRELKEIAGIMRQYAQVIGRKKVAIITSRPVAFGVARQFGALLTSGLLTVHVFKDRSAGLTWLTERPE